MDSEQVPDDGIVVGVDGSPSSQRAVEWGARQAALEHRPLVLVHSEPPPSALTAGWLASMGVDRAQLDEEVRLEQRSLLTDAAGAARAAHPGLEVHQVLRLADARQSLLELSDDASAVVVGSRGHGPIRSLLLGSVSMAVSTRAHSPVVVVRESVPSPRRGVVVGVEGEGRDRAALEVAYRVAHLRGLPVTAVHCFWDAVHIEEGARDVPDDEPGLDDRRAILTEATAGLAERYPDVTTHHVLSRGFVDVRLVGASREAELIVIGHRRKPLLNEIVYGSVAPRIIERSHCSVIVVPHLAETPIT